MPINVMVSLNGVNEEGKSVVALHIFEAASEEDVIKWVESAPAIKRNIDDGPALRVEIPRINNRRKE